MSDSESVFRNFDEIFLNATRFYFFISGLFEKGGGNYSYIHDLLTLPLSVLTTPPSTRCSRLQLLAENQFLTKSVSVFNEQFKHVYVEVYVLDCLYFLNQSYNQIIFSRGVKSDLLADVRLLG